MKALQNIAAARTATVVSVANAEPGNGVPDWCPDTARGAAETVGIGRATHRASGKASKAQADAAIRAGARSAVVDLTTYTTIGAHPRYVVAQRCLYQRFNPDGPREGWFYSVGARGPIVPPEGLALPPSRAGDRVLVAVAAYGRVRTWAWYEPVGLGPVPPDDRYLPYEIGGGGGQALKAR